jgi:hypothetical protein
LFRTGRNVTIQQTADYCLVASAGSVIVKNYAIKRDIYPRCTETANFKDLCLHCVIRGFKYIYIIKNTFVTENPEQITDIHIVLTVYIHVCCVNTFTYGLKIFIKCNVVCKVNVKLYLSSLKHHTRKDMPCPGKMLKDKSTESESVA